jgi:hypothetical protein
MEERRKTIGMKRIRQALWEANRPQMRKVDSKMFHYLRDIMPPQAIEFSEAISGVDAEEVEIVSQQQEVIDLTLDDDAMSSCSMASISSIDYM